MNDGAMVAFAKSLRVAFGETCAQLIPNAQWAAGTSLESERTRFRNMEEQFGKVGLRAKVGTGKVFSNGRFSETISISAYVPPTDDKKFDEALANCRAIYGFDVLSGMRGVRGKPIDDEKGYVDALDRANRYDALIAEQLSDTKLDSKACQNQVWVQAYDGTPQSVQSLFDGFQSIIANPAVRAFPLRGMTMSYTGIQCPYGLPVAILQTRDLSQETLMLIARALKEANPSLPLVIGYKPGMLGVHNLPPIDGIWDESRFWDSWQSAWPDVSPLIDSWIAVRFRTFVHAPGGGEHVFHDKAYLPWQAAASEADIALPQCSERPVFRADVAAWAQRRSCELLLALHLDPDLDPGLQRHIYGSLATPHPFMQRLSPVHVEIKPHDAWFGVCGATLHRILMEEERCQSGQGARTYVTENLAPLLKRNMKIMLDILTRFL